MNETENRFYCDDSLKYGEEEKWKYLLEYAFEKADFVEFNILYSNQEITNEIESLSEFLVEKSKRSEKIYANGNYFVRYELTDKLKEFIKSKKYEDWNGFNYEDISFVKNGKEFFATNTHENLVIMEMNKALKEKLTKKGFDFWCDWGINPAKSE
jgi:hypothetical protein